VTPQQRTVLGAGSFAVALVGVYGILGLYWVALVAGTLGVALALLLAIGAAR
jgi:hypothetical protein